MDRFYLDTSTLIKRARSEPESQALRSWLNGIATSQSRLFTSTLTVVEVERGLRSLAARGSQDISRIVSAVPMALTGLSQLPLTDQVLQMARWIGPDNLRSPDAIHLASAVLNGATVMVTYDKRLTEAAKSVGLSTLAPA